MQVQTAVLGKVTQTEDGAATAGVNITVKGTSSGTVSDMDGNCNYRITYWQAETDLASLIRFYESQ